MYNKKTIYIYKILYRFNLYKYIKVYTLEAYFSILIK